jgi:hypothetical protein
MLTEFRLKIGRRDNGHYVTFVTPNPNSTTLGVSNTSIDEHTSDGLEKLFEYIDWNCEPDEAKHLKQGLSCGETSWPISEQSACKWMRSTKRRQVLCKKRAISPLTRDIGASVTDHAH